MAESQGSPEFDSRRFLFLQGPHGPFFGRLADMLRAAGAQVWRVAFNAGDAAFWSGRRGLIHFEDPLQAWPATLNRLIDTHAISDIVLYGDTRPIHAIAVEQARARGLTIHVFEEGYLRPYWVTYERGGTNGNSRLMDMSVAHMRAALGTCDTDTPMAPTRWGDMRQHVFYGALYHFAVMFLNRRYRHFRPHRALPVRREFLLYLQRLILMPLTSLERSLVHLRINWGGFPYHLVLLQLEHDAAFRCHSEFQSMTEFVDLVLEGFAKGAQRHHRLVFKAHPLESGQVPLRRLVQTRARALGIASRVHFVPGGKLAQLLDHAHTAVTVNSTAAQQVLHRGLPIRAFGQAVYDKPEFVSDQPLAEFFAKPRRPDTTAYRDYRSYLLETSQIAGGFYSSRGRRRLLRQVVDMMLDRRDPYDALAANSAPHRHRLHLVQ